MQRTISLLLFVLVLASAFLCSCEGEHSGTPASTSDDVTPAVTEETDEISAGTSEQEQTSALPVENEDPLIGTWVHVGGDQVKRGVTLYTLYENGSCGRGSIYPDHYIKYNYDYKYSVEGNNLDIYYAGGSGHTTYESGEYAINDNTLTLTDSSGAVTCTMKRFTGFDQKPTADFTKEYVKDVIRLQLDEYFYINAYERNYLDNIDSYDIDIETDYFKTVSAGKSYGAIVSAMIPRTDEIWRETMYCIWVPDFECWSVFSIELEERVAD